MGLVAAERDNVLVGGEPREHLAEGGLRGRHVRDDRAAVGARDADRERVRPDERPATVGVGEPRRRGGGQQRDEPALGEPSDVVAEHPGGKAVRRRDHARVLWWLRQLGVDDRRQGQVAERASAFPPLEAVRREHSFGLRVGVDVGQRLEPGDPRVAVTELPAPLGVVEVAEERLDVGIGEAERRDPPAGLLRLHERRT